MDEGYLGRKTIFMFSQTKNEGQTGSGEKQKVLSKDQLIQTTGCLSAAARL